MDGSNPGCSLIWGKRVRVGDSAVSAAWMACQASQEVDRVDMGRELTDGLGWDGDPICLVWVAVYA